MEFGSDFHLESKYKGSNCLNYFPKANLYASGRQAIKALAIARKWRRLWVPSYFCRESLLCLRDTNVELLEYPCIPTDDLESVVKSIHTDKYDGLLVVNYFGLNKMFRFECNAEIIEDHTHDLLGYWSCKSEADWCIASLRKTLPIADGGILWSPQNHILPTKPSLTRDVESAMKKRYEAMILKRKYIEGFPIDKTRFLSVFNYTEEGFDSFHISNISNQSLEILSNFDIISWYNQKKRNYQILCNFLHLTSGVYVLKSYFKEGTIFSLILMFEDSEYRNRVRKNLIEQSVYPAVLWNLDSSIHRKSKDFGNKMLSIHCDGRYSESDMSILADIINKTLITCK